MLTLIRLDSISTDSVDLFSRKIEDTKLLLQEPKNESVIGSENAAERQESQERGLRSR